MGKVEKLQIIKKKSFENQIQKLSGDDFDIFWHVAKKEAYNRGRLI